MILRRFSYRQEIFIPSLIETSYKRSDVHGRFDPYVEISAPPRRCSSSWSFSPALSSSMLWRSSHHEFQSWNRPRFLEIVDWFSKLDFSDPPLLLWEDLNWKVLQFGNLCSNNWMKKAKETLRTDDHQCCLCASRPSLLEGEPHPLGQQLRCRRFPGKPRLRSGTDRCQVRLWFLRAPGFCPYCDVEVIRYCKSASAVTEAGTLVTSSKR